MNGTARDDIDAVLAARARLLARPAERIDDVPTIELVEFVCGNERYAVEVRYVYRLERMGRVAPLPGAPRQFVGITNLHGQLVPLVEIGGLLGAPVCADAQFVVVLGGARAEIGVVVDELRDIRAVARESLSAPSTASIRPIVRYITPDGTAVIDGAAVIADPRLTASDAAPTHEENAR